MAYVLVYELFGTLLYWSDEDETYVGDINRATLYSADDAYTKSTVGFERFMDFNKLIEEVEND